MNEELSKYFIVEKYINDEWILVWSYNSLSDAIHKFSDLLQESDAAIVRITSPTDISIYTPRKERVWR